LRLRAVVETLHFAGAIGVRLEVAALLLGCVAVRSRSFASTARKAGGRDMVSNMLSFQTIDEMQLDDNNVIEVTPS
jgi:hypothetical protein